MMPNVLKSAGMSKIMENAERLNNYMKSIDEDLRNMQQAFNNNFKLYADALDKLQEDLAEIHKKVDELCKTKKG